MGPIGLELLTTRYLGFKGLGFRSLCVPNVLPSDAYQCETFQPGS